MPTPNNTRDHVDWKLHAAQRALQLVESGMTLGLGSGSTATLWIKLLGEQVRDHGLEIRAIASSEDSERLGRSYGIPFVTFEECKTLDLTVDGADEIAPGLALIKGGGGKLLRERLLRAHPNVSWWSPANRNKSKSSADSLYLLKSFVWPLHW